MSYSGGKDLRDALAPHAGDPVADAARVLERLPKPVLPPIAWWLLGLGLAVGVVVGVWFGTRRDVPEETRTEPPPVKREDPPPPKEKIGIDPPEAEERILFYGLGEVQVREGDSPVQTLSAEHMLSMGAGVETGNSIVGMLLAYDIQVRMDRDTAVRIEKSRRIQLDHGRIWVHSGGDWSGMVGVHTARGTAEIRGGAAVVEFLERRLRVVSFKGSAAIFAEDGRVEMRLAEGESGWVGNGERGAPEREDFPERNTSWMTRLLLRQQDQSELVDRIDRMLREYFGTRHRTEAAAELRRIGNACVPRFVERLSRIGSLPVGFLRDTVRMIGNMAERSTLRDLFSLLYFSDPEVRAIAFASIYRITGENGGVDEAFWRDDGNQAAREQKIKSWWERVNR